MSSDPNTVSQLLTYGRDRLEDRTLKKEDDTKKQVITKILEKGCNWQTESTVENALLQMEESSSIAESNRRPDYTLKWRTASDGQYKEHMLIEAKPIGTNLDERQRKSLSLKTLQSANVDFAKQLVETTEDQIKFDESPVEQICAYSRSNPLFACVTNGLEWRFYLAGAERANWEDREFKRIKIDAASNELNIDEAASTLIELLSIPTNDAARDKMKHRALELLEKRHKEEALINDLLETEWNIIDETRQSLSTRLYEYTDIQVAKGIIDYLNRTFFGTETTHGTATSVVQGSQKASKSEARNKGRTLKPFRFADQAIEPASNPDAFRQVVEATWKKAGQEKFDSIMQLSDTKFRTFISSDASRFNQRSEQLLDTKYYLNLSGSYDEFVRRITTVHETFFPGESLQLQSKSKG